MSRFAGFFSSFLRWSLGVLMVLLAPLPALVGYYAGACPQENPIGRAILGMLGLAIQFPIAAVVFAIGALFFWPVMKSALGESSYRKIITWGAVLMGCAGLLVWGLTKAVGTSARCSVLW